MLVVHAHDPSDEDASFIQSETINEPTEQKIDSAVREGGECCSCKACYYWIGRCDTSLSSCVNWCFDSKCCKFCDSNVDPKIIEDINRRKYEKNTCGNCGERLPK